MIKSFTNPTSQLERIYGLIALVGLVFTQYFNYQFYLLNQDSLNMLGWFQGGFVNPAASSISSDAYVGGLAAFIFIFFEAKRLGIKHGWAYIVGGLFIAFAFTFPLFLMVREHY